VAWAREVLATALRELLAINASRLLQRPGQ